GPLAADPLGQRAGDPRPGADRTGGEPDLRALRRDGVLHPGARGGVRAWPPPHAVPRRAVPLAGIRAMRTRIRTARGGVAPLLLPLLLAAGAAACGGGTGDPPELGGIATVAERGASNPTVALDPRTGRSYVAWVGSEEGISNVYLAVAEPGASFAGPVRVNDLPGDAAPHEQAPAQVAVGPEGNVYVLWQNST